MKIDRYKRFCGPACVASVYSAPREEAAELLTKVGGNVGNGGTNVEALSVALDAPLVYLKPWYPNKVKDVYVRGTWRKRGGWRRMTAYAFPTTTQFLREHPEGEYVLMSRNHVIHVKDGEVIEDNGSGGSRMRITGAWPIGGATVKVRGR